MKQVIIVKTGEGYGDNEYTFEKETEAIDFFKAIGKAKKLAKEYISGGVGYVYTESNETTKASLTYANFYSKAELVELQEKEAKRIAAEEAAREAEDQRVKEAEESANSELLITEGR